MLEELRLTPAQVRKYLGVPKFRTHKREETAEVGMANGLAWTQNGGEILHIEVTTMPGKGKPIITGKLGDVMQESARAEVVGVRPAEPLGEEDAAPWTRLPSGRRQTAISTAHSSMVCNFERLHHGGPLIRPP